MKPEMIEIEHAPGTVYRYSDAAYYLLCRLIEAVSGMGLMIGLKTKKPAAEVVRECLERGVLCLTAKDKVRLLPALNIPMEVLQKAAEIIKAACK